MIVRMLQALSAFALISACVVFAFCIDQWRKGAIVIEANPGFSIKDKFKRASRSNEKSNRKTVSPLIKQADAFALYLNPPKPKEAPVLRSSKQQTVAVVRPVKSKPKFTLAATSYYSSSPEESMALVSEPGSGYRWVKQGQRLGRFVVERIESGSIAYRNGDQLLEMAVNTDIPSITTQAGQTTLASSQSSTALFTTSDIGKPNSITQKIVPITSPTRPEIQPTINRRVAVQTRHAVVASAQTSTSPPRPPNSQRARTIKHKTTSRPDPAMRKMQQTVYDRRRNRT